MKIAWMNYKYLSTFAMLALCFAMSMASAQSFTTPKNELELRQKIAESSSKIQTIQCIFLQEKKMSMMKNKHTSHGMFYFVKPDKIRLEYHQPNFQAIIIEGSNAYLQDSSKTTKISAAKSKSFQQLNQVIVSSVTGSLLNSKDFFTHILENEKAVKVELIPVSKQLKGFIESVVLILDKRDFTATRVELNEGHGDYTHLHFSNKLFNQPVPETLFRVQLK
jgi:outer membrane lipoprotein-sorting protein